jgi:hypothetical protein
MRVSRTCPSCGYTADYASAPLAGAHHPRHSCAKHRRGLDQAARRAERLQARVPRECAHPQARHRHGTRAAYVKDRCRCTDCTAANTAASRSVTRERIYGRWQPYVDADPVREHIAALRAAGIGVERIAHLAGLSVKHIRELAQRGRGDSSRTQRVRPSTAARVLGIGVHDAKRAPHSRVDATGTRRRLQALIAIGWPAELLAAQLGRRPNSLCRSMAGESVTARTAHDVTDDQRAACCGRCRPSPGRGTRLAATAGLGRHRHRSHPAAGDRRRLPAKRHGRDRRGTCPCGDHITYDDLTTVEQQEVVRRLTARGSSIRDIAAQLGTTKRTVSRRRASFVAA